MKTSLRCIVLTVLCIATLACRGNQEDLGIVDHVRLRSVFLVEDASGNLTLAVAKEDTVDTDYCILNADAYNREGWRIPLAVHWRVSDETIAWVTPILSAEYETLAIVRGLKDIIDLDESVEPEVTITACVINDCSGGGECSPEVCSEPLLVRIVINAEGSWIAAGATFPFAIELAVSQTGRHLTAATYTLDIHERRVFFTSGDYQYDGEFRSREYILGRATNSAGADLGEWTATKCPDDGCPPSP